MLCYLCYFDSFQYKKQIGCVDILVFSSQPTELPWILAQDRPKSHDMTTVLKDYDLNYCMWYQNGIKSLHTVNSNKKMKNFLLDSKENIIDQMSIFYRDNIFVPMCALLWMGLVFLIRSQGATFWVQEFF